VATSRVPALIDYLVTLFQTAATLGTATPPVAVYDGPVVTQEPAQLVLFIGMDDPDADVPVSASSDQTWAGLGKQAKNEEITITCVAEAWGGDTDIKAIRVAAYAIVGAVEDLVRADVQIHSGITLFGGISSMTLVQNQTTQGAVARVTFQITGQARI
jgi:hypothetical protein